MTLATEPLAAATLVRAAAASKVKRLVLISSIKAMGEASRSQAAAHDARQMTDRYFDLYAELLADRRLASELR